MTGRRYGEYTTPYYKFQWSRSLDDKDNPLTYTLLEYDSPNARLGQPIMVAADSYTAERLLYPGEGGAKYYRVLVSDPEGLYITAVKEEGLLNGYGDSTFGPDSPISRAETAVVLKKALQLEEGAGGQDVAAGFSDIKNHWAQKEIFLITGRNIMSGYPDGTFKPDGNLTRAEAAAVLSRAV